MFHNISNPKWFGKWSRLEDDYLYNDGTDTSGNFVFSKMEKTGGKKAAGFLFSSCPAGTHTQSVLRRNNCGWAAAGR